MPVNLKLINLSAFKLCVVNCMGNDSDNIQEAIISVIGYGMALTWTVSAWDNSSLFISQCSLY
jgi:hypothetical protein